ncbi:MAG: hypothetical protein ACYDBH_19615 [Acidobacteriaceae bacterium]
MTTYTKPVAVNALARSVAVVTVSGSPALPDCYAPSLYTVGSNGLVETTFSGLTGGFGSSAADGNGGAWLCGYSGNLIDVTSALVTGSSYALPANTTFTGCTVISGSPYIMASGGQAMTVSGGAIVDVTPAFTGPAWGLQEYNGTLYTLLPAAAEIGELALSSATSGTQSTLAIPMTTPSCFAVSVSGVIGVGGWSPVTLAYGFSAFSYAAGTVNLLAGINQANNTVQTLISTKRNFTVNQTLTGSGAPSGVAWTPTNEQLFVSDATNNVVTVYNLTGQTLASSHTFTVSGATSIAIIPNATQALICQPSKNLVTVLNNANNVWTSGSTVAITNPIAVLALSDTSAVVADGSGVSVLTNNSGTWSVTATAALAYTPTALAMDDVGGVYVVGVSGSTATLSVFFSQTLVGGLSWTGGAVSVLWRQGQIVVGDDTNSVARVIGLASGSYQQFGSLATPATLLTIGAANESLFLSDQTQSYQCQFGAPYQLVRTESGSAAIYTSSWSQTVLGIGDRPTAAVFDASGNLWVATDNNTVYEINGGGIVSTVIVEQNDVQNQSVPVGISSLLWNSGHLYGSTCLKGGLVEVQ